MGKYMTREQVVADFNINFSDLFNGLRKRIRTLLEYEPRYVTKK